MKQRLAILDEHNLTIHDIQGVIDKMGPLEGAADFVAWLRERCQVIILSDTFYQFAQPLMRQLGFPTLFCNHWRSIKPAASSITICGCRIKRSTRWPRSNRLTSRPGCRRCLQRHCHVGRSTRGVLFLSSGSPPKEFRSFQ